MSIMPEPSKGAFLIATLGGLVRFTAMPGTLGSVAAFIPALFFPIPLWLPPAAAVIGTWAAHRYARDTGKEDPGEVIVDEVVGLWTALALVPRALAFPALFLFRVVDILKPFPVNVSERLPGGVGIMADDIVGGLMTAGLLLGLRWLYVQGGLAAFLGG